jgi:hypothetical protein
MITLRFAMGLLCTLASVVLSWGLGAAMNAGGRGLFRSTVLYAETMSGLKTATTGLLTLRVRLAGKWHDESLSRLTELATGFLRRTSSSEEKESKITVVSLVFWSLMLPVFMSTSRFGWYGDPLPNFSGTVMTHCNTAVLDSDKHTPSIQPHQYFHATLFGKVCAFLKDVLVLFPKRNLLELMLGHANRIKSFLDQIAFSLRNW